MTKSDRFWRLEGANKIATQSDFFDHLKKSDHLKNALYEPNELTQTDPLRTERITGKIFESVSFSKTVIDSIIFRDCEFRDCQFIGATLRSCEFHGCRFVNTNTHKISIERTYIDPRSFGKCLDRNKHQNIGVHLYQVLLNNSRDEEQIEFERDAQFLFLRWKRYQDGYEFKRTLESRGGTNRYLRALPKGISALKRLLWEKLFGCGIRLRYFVVTVIVTIFLATCSNYAFSEAFGLNVEGRPLNSWFEAFYFSTVSLTTLGYGDITPSTPLGQFVASIQSIVGFSLFALLASMLFRRVTP